MRYLHALVLGVGLCGVPVSSRAAPTAAGVSQSAAPVPAPAPPTQSHRAGGVNAESTPHAADNASDLARYAQREAQSSKALEFRGGNTVVIGTTAAVVILAIVLVVVLL